MLTMKEIDFIRQVLQDLEIPEKAYMPVKSKLDQLPWSTKIMFTFFASYLLVAKSVKSDDSCLLLFVASLFSVELA